MHKLSIPCMVMASINFFVGIYSILQYKMQRGMREYLPFAFLCLSVGLYDLASIGLYDSISVLEGTVWQRLQFEIIAAISIFLIWFTAILTEQPKNKLLKILPAVFAMILVVSFFTDHSLTVSASNPAIKHINVPHIPEITYYEGEAGIILQLELVMALLSYMYLSFLFFRYYRKSREVSLLLVVASQAIYFVGVLNDSLVSIQAYDFIYISEYSFFFVVFSMAIVLLARFVTLSRSHEELSENLELKVVERTLEIEKLSQELQHLADYDALTGVHNRRFFNKYFEIEIKRARNQLEHRPHLQCSGDDMNFGLAIIDVDHFKQINDTYGHLAGDRILAEVIETIKSNIFTRDVLCRYGGDEFALLMTKTSNDGIIQAVEKIRREVEVRRFEFDEDHRNERVTISIGVVNFNETLHSGNSEIIKTADDRLLKAKSLGRNRVISVP